MHLADLCECSVSGSGTRTRDGAAWPPAVEHWRAALGALQPQLPAPDAPFDEQMSHLSALATDGETGGAAAAFGVACLRVFWQANVTGPTPRLPQCALDASADPDDVKIAQVCSAVLPVTACRCACTNSAATPSLHWGTEGMLIECWLNADCA